MNLFISEIPVCLSLGGLGLHGLLPGVFINGDRKAEWILLLSKGIHVIVLSTPNVNDNTIMSK